MRTMWTGSVLVAAMIAGLASEACARAKPVRRAELITMAAGVTDQTRAAPAPRSGAAGDAIDGFAVHDLSRRWVAFQMAGYASPQLRGVDDSPADAGILAPARFDVPRAAMRTIPAWMNRGAAPLASPSYVPVCASVPYRPTGFLRVDAEQRRAGLYAMMSDIACAHGIPVGLFDAMIMRESQYRPDVFSAKNAFGLTQLMPGTATSLGVNRYSIEGNLRGGARYLRQQLDRFGQYHLALAAYNAGPGRVRDGRVPAIPETQAYVANVLSNWSRLTGMTTEFWKDSQAAVPQPTVGDRRGRRATVASF